MKRIHQIPNKLHAEERIKQEGTNSQEENIICEHSQPHDH